MRILRVLAPYLAVAVLVAAAGALTLRVTGWTPLRSTTNVHHATAVAAVLADRTLCGADVTLTWELTRTERLHPLPDVIVGRDATGIVHAGATACSTGPVAITDNPDGTVTITLAEPHITDAWVDVEATDLPHQSRGLLTRLFDGVTCVWGDCDTAMSAADAWLDDAGREARRLAAETNAVEVAETEIAALVAELTAPWQPTIEFAPPTTPTATTIEPEEPRAENNP
jgi:hypothetical protein